MMRILVGLIGVIDAVIAVTMLLVSPMLAMAYDAPGATPEKGIGLYFLALLLMAINACVCLAEAGRKEPDNTK